MRARGALAPPCPVGVRGVHRAAGMPAGGGTGAAVTGPESSSAAPWPAAPAWRSRDHRPWPQRRRPATRVIPSRAPSRERLYFAPLCRRAGAAVVGVLRPSSSDSSPPPLLSPLPPLSPRTTCDTINSCSLKPVFELLKVLRRSLPHPQPLCDLQIYGTRGNEKETPLLL